MSWPLLGKGEPREGPAPPPELAPEVAQEDRAAPAIRCAACGHPITTASQRISVAGAHQHTRLNPHGYVFLFGCFRAAPGCAVAGVPTEEDTWFPGHRWSHALCGACGAHLGWRFDGAGAESFFGLVLERLVEEDPAPRS